jgi:hypothetical protein
MRNGPCRYLVLLTSDNPLLILSGTTAAVTIYDNGYDDLRMRPQNNYGGWVNPEDLPPMPQCIAQQDPSAWLEAMTRCITRGCTRHFGIICTHHQWLARLDCLRTDFTADLVRQYIPLCSRSILAKKQLYSWINTITGRTWLTEVGDSTEVQDISHLSLVAGYIEYEVVNKAPLCLRVSSSLLTAENFQHITSSCSFTGQTKHTGNAARPWEYNEGIRSMVALDFATAGYDLTHHQILDGQYIDNECLCTSYTIDINEEPCKERAQSLDLTRERLWMMATCGSRSIPYSWTKNLRTIGDAYIFVENWSWPAVIAYTPQHAELLVRKCATDACEIDERGYCRTKRAVERACLCRDVSYSLCGWSCKDFEARISYVNWLHEACGAVHGWHGLPEDWKQLAQPSFLDMIPWHWPVIKPEHSKPAPYSTLMLFNFLVTIINFGCYMVDSYRVSHGFPLLSIPRHWFLRGMSMIGLQVLAYWINALIIGSTPGYEGTSNLEMILLWCSMPRLTWLLFLLIGIQPMEKIDLTAAASALWAEAVFQALSSYHLLKTIIYGFKHSFYFGRLVEVDTGGSAQLMYFGALMWLIVVGLTVLQCMRIDSIFLRRWHKIDWSSRSFDGEPTARFAERCAWIDEQFAYFCMGRFKGISHQSSGSGTRRHYTNYGSINNVPDHHTIREAGTGSLYALGLTSMILLWISQLLFWIGLIAIISAAYEPSRDV